MLIAITGKAHAGKDTAAAALIKTLGFTPMAFAEPLKESCMFKFGLSHNDVFTHEGKARFIPEWNLTVGEILQKEGTEATKTFWGEDFWVRRWRMTYDEFLKVGVTDVVLTDCRFDSEAEAITSMGGKVIRITRPDFAPADARDPNHASERGISDQFVSGFIVNNRGVKELKNSVLEMVRGWQANG